MSKAILLALALCLCAIPVSAAQAQQNPSANQQADASALTEGIISEAAKSAGLINSFGNPAWFMETGKNQADILVEFPNGPLPDLAAAEFGLMACARLARNAALSQSGIRRMGLTVTSPLPDGRIRVYGKAIYNGNLAALIWENAGLNLEASSAPKIGKKARRSVAQKSRAANQQVIPGQPVREEAVEEEVIVIDPNSPNAPKAPVKPAPQQKMQAARQPGQPVGEAVVEEEVVVIDPTAPQANAPQQKPRFGQPMVQPRGVMQFPQNVTPGAIMPKPKDGNCPYLEGLARQKSTGCPYLDQKAQARPESNCPYLNSLAQPGAKPAPRAMIPQAPGNSQNANPADQNPALASYSSVAQAILNDTAAETGVQDFFGNPVFWINAQDKEAEMMVQFRNGPLPARAAKTYGLNACANLARAYVSKGLGPKRLTLTVTSVLPRGAMMIYGTAIYNGSINDIAWQNFGLTVGPGPFNGPMPTPPFVQQEMDAAQPDQQPQRRPLNVRPQPRKLPLGQQPGDAQATPPAVQQPQVRAVKPPVAQQPQAQTAPAAPKQESARQQAANDQPAGKEAGGEKIEENPADDASYSYPARSIINGAARAIGLQSSYGLPECSVVAGDYKADILAQFKHGPMSDSLAASFGRLACERLARAYIVKGFGTKQLSVTVSYTMEDGRRHDYGTAVFNGSLDDISWLAAGRNI